VAEGEETPSKEVQDEIELSNLNHGMLMSKINGQMLFNCQDFITEEQITEVHKFKTTPESFDTSRSGFHSLVHVNFDEFNEEGVEEDGKIKRIIYTN